MANPKRILVVCGTGIATATLVANKVKNALAARGITIVISVCNADDAAEKAQDFRPDCVISTTYLDGRLAVPVFRGLPFLTGVKEEQALSVLVDFLNGSAQPAA